MNGCKLPGSVEILPPHNRRVIGLSRVVLSPLLYSLSRLITQPSTCLTSLRFRSERRLLPVTSNVSHPVVTPDVTAGEYAAGRSEQAEGRQPCDRRRWRAKRSSARSDSWPRPGRVSRAGNESCTTKDERAVTDGDFLKGKGYSSAAWPVGGPASLPNASRRLHV